MENTILFGNGFNRLNNNGISWEDILNDLKNDKFVNGDLPYTMIYEKALLDNSSSFQNEFIEFEYSVKEKLAGLMKNIKPSSIYKDLINLNLKNYLTTNYDYCLNNVFLGSSQLKQINQSSEEIYSIRRKTLINDYSDNEISAIWNIHGEIDKPASLMLGYDHYTGSMSKLESYVKGNYDFVQNKETIKAEKMRNKLLTGNFDNYSWIEQFFKSNIHIIGLKLDYSETDIYWILNKRLRLYKELNNKISVRNKVIYYTNDDNSHKTSLLKSFGVDVKYKKGTFKDVYDFAINSVK